MITSEEMKMDRDVVDKRALSGADTCNARGPMPIPTEGTESVRAYQSRLDAFEVRGGIGWAVKQMQHGLKMRRSGWNGRNMWLAIQWPDLGSKMTVPYVYMRTADGELVPWLWCSQTDLLSTDWEVATAD